jgi:hypothetical protein
MRKTLVERFDSSHNPRTRNRRLKSAARTFLVNHLSGCTDPRRIATALTRLATSPEYRFDRSQINEIHRGLMAVKGLKYVPVPVSVIRTAHRFLDINHRVDFLAGVSDQTPFHAAAGVLVIGHGITDLSSVAAISLCGYAVLSTDGEVTRTPVEMAYLLKGIGSSGLKRSGAMADVLNGLPPGSTPMAMKRAYRICSGSMNRLDMALMDDWNCSDTFQVDSFVYSTGLNLRWSTLAEKALTATRFQDWSVTLISCEHRDGIAGPELYQRFVDWCAVRGYRAGTRRGFNACLHSIGVFSKQVSVPVPGSEPAGWDNRVYTYPVQVSG